MDAADPTRARIADNPFHVLGLKPDCTRVDVERAGQKWLAMLEVGLSSAATYDTPFGKRTRDADKVRQAMAELRDPDKRLVHELWAALPADELVLAPTSPGTEEAAIPPWPELSSALGWETRT